MLISVPFPSYVAIKKLEEKGFLQRGSIADLLPMIKMSYQGGTSKAEKIRAGIYYIYYLIEFQGSQ